MGEITPGQLLKHSVGEKAEGKARQFQEAHVGPFNIPFLTWTPSKHKAGLGLTLD